MVVMVWSDVVMGPFGEEEGEGAMAGENRKERGVKRGGGAEGERWRERICHHSQSLVLSHSKPVLPVSRQSQAPTLGPAPKINPSSFQPAVHKWGTRSCHLGQGAV